MFPPIEEARGVDRADPQLRRLSVEVSRLRRNGQHTEAARLEAHDQPSHRRQRRISEHVRISMHPTRDTADDFGDTFGCIPNTEEEKLIANELHAVYARLSTEDEELANSMKFSWDGDNSQEPAYIFRLLDLDGDGLLTYDEVVQGLQNRGLPETQLKEIFEALNVGGDMQVTLGEFEERFAVWQNKVQQHPGSHVADMMLDSALASFTSRFEGLASAGERTTVPLSRFFHTALETNPYHIPTLLRAAGLRIRLLHFDEAIRLLGRAVGVGGPSASFALGAIRAVRKAEEYQLEWKDGEEVEGMDLLRASGVIDRGLPDEFALAAATAAQKAAEDAIAAEGAWLEAQKREAAEEAAAEKAAERAAAEKRDTEKAAALKAAADKLRAEKEAADTAKLEAAAEAELLALLRDAIAESAAEVNGLVTMLQDATDANAIEVQLLQQEFKVSQDEIARVKGKAKSKGSKYDVPSTPIMKKRFSALSPSQLTELETNM